MASPKNRTQLASKLPAPPRPETVTRSICFQVSLLKLVEEAAAQEDRSVSSWVNRAARKALTGHASRRLEIS